MALLTANDKMQYIQEWLLLQLNPSFQFGQSSDGYTTANATFGGDSVWFKVASTGNAGRTNGVGQAQAFYSPHKFQWISDSNYSETLAIAVSGWVAGNSITSTVNGNVGTAVAFTANNNASAAALAAQLLADFGPAGGVTAGLIQSATAALGTISIVAAAGVTLAISFAQSVPAATLAQTAHLPSQQLRDFVSFVGALQGMRVEHYEVPAIYSYSSFDAALAAATLISAIRPDPFNPITQSQ